ncbi:SUF system Fe-S cluster assembly protein [Paraburkholderia flagellata]|uniref:SUF system Fe-S cluster assembly protein n=1 Tax=Paraburkholderia flagellata TaxID=2883241 RepID=UPI001F30B038|nr:SUF system Fe-S cluster assembly protein [Paraburkholderia flagellata]
MDTQTTGNDLRERVIDALRSVFDPEIPVNIYDLGLVYQLDVDAEAGSVTIHMTLTAPGCPVAQTFPGTVEECVNDVEGVSATHVELVWDPPWTRARMSEAALLQLGML